MGPWWRGTKAVLRAGLVSPILSNLFLHYAFDRWMQRHFAEIRFERFADDAICHCKTWAQAQRLRAALERRFAECHLELHPQKTRVVYCKDDDRRGAYLTTALTSWDIRFGPGAQRIGGESTSSISLLPSAIQLRRRCAGRCEAGRCRIGVIKSLEDLARMFNPVVRGWINYFASFYQAALYPTLRHVDSYLALWAARKYKKLHRHRRRARHWLARVAQSRPTLFAHWQLVRPTAG